MCGIEGDDVVYFFWEFVFQYFYLGVYQFGYFQCIGVGLQEDVYGDGWLFVQSYLLVVIVGVEFDGGDVLQVEQVVGVVGMDDDIVEFFRGQQLVFGGYCVGQYLVIWGGFLVDFVGGVLGVL